MSAVIYHGSKQERETIRMKLMPKTIGPKFPLVITSYEVVLRDAKFLSRYKWKYVVVDEVAPNFSQYFLPVLFSFHTGFCLILCFLSLVHAFL